MAYPREASLHRFQDLVCRKGPQPSGQQWGLTRKFHYQRREVESETLPTLGWGWVRLVYLI